MSKRHKSTPDKPLCYRCRYRGSLIGDCHSRCLHPSIHRALSVNKLASALVSLFSGHMRGHPPEKFGEVETSFNQHGIDGGWAAWPFNFDPIWLEWCTGFKKESK